MNIKQVQDAIKVFFMILQTKMDGDVLMYDGSIINTIKIKDDGIEIGNVGYISTTYNGKPFTVLTTKKESEDTHE